jgi:hypothetical protein
MTFLVSGMTFICPELRPLSESVRAAFCCICPAPIRTADGGLLGNPLPYLASRSSGCRPDLLSAASGFHYGNSFFNPEPAARQRRRAAVPSEDGAVSGPAPARDLDRFRGFRHTGFGVICDYANPLRGLYETRSIWYTLYVMQHFDSSVASEHDKIPPFCAKRGGFQKR